MDHLIPTVKKTEFHISSCQSIHLNWIHFYTKEDSASSWDFSQDWQIDNSKKKSWDLNYLKLAIHTCMCLLLLTVISFELLTEKKKKKREMIALEAPSLNNYIVIRFGWKLGTLSWNTSYNFSFISPTLSGQKKGSKYTNTLWISKTRDQEPKSDTEQKSAD